MRVEESIMCSGPITRGMAPQWLLALAACVPLNVLAAQPENAFWLDAVSGRWDDAARWSTQAFYPQNGFPDPDDTYRATIDAAGGAYTVLMDDVFATYAVAELVLDSADATFEHRRGQFQVGTVNLLRGTYYFNGDSGLAALEDAVVNIGPDGRFVFATAPSDQATGNFRRCIINGDLRLDRVNSGVVFEDSVDLNGDIYLDAQRSAAMFNGTSMRLDHSTIYAGYNTRIEMFAVRDGFTLGQDARIIGAPVIRARSGYGSTFRNEGEIHLTSYSIIEDQVVENAGTMTVAADRTTIRGEARLSNTGDLFIAEDADLYLNLLETSTNDGLISVAPEGRLRTTVAFEIGPDAVSEFLIDPTLGSGFLALGDIRYQSVLGGTLRVLVSDTGGFSLGEEYWLVRCDNYAGEFAVFDLPALDGGLGFAVDYRSDGVHAVIVPCPGAASLVLLGAGMLSRRGRRAE